MVGALYGQTLNFKFVWDDDQLIYGRADYHIAIYTEEVREDRVPLRAEPLANPTPHPDRA
jgi:hypothetical protein